MPTVRTDNASGYIDPSGTATLGAYDTTAKAQSSARLNAEAAPFQQAFLFRLEACWKGAASALRLADD